MATSTWKPESSRIKFQLLGTPTLSLQCGTNAEGETVWFDHKKAKKFEIPDTHVVKHKSGKPIDGGRIRFANGIRVISFPADEKAIIDALYYSPHCQNGPNGKKSISSFIMIDDEKEKREKYNASLRRKTAMQLFINTSVPDMRDIAVCLGFDDEDEQLYEPNLASYVERNPEKYGEFFDKGELKEEYRVQAIVRRAQKHKVLEVSKGAYYFNKELIGADLQATVMNLMNSTEGSASSKADALPLIKDALKKKIDPYGKKAKLGKI